MGLSKGKQCVQNGRCSRAFSCRTMVFECPMVKNADLGLNAANVLLGFNDVSNSTAETHFKRLNMPMELLQGFSVDAAISAAVS